MQDASSLTSEISTVLYSLNTVKFRSLFGDSWSHLTEIPCKIKIENQIMYFQHTVVQYIHHSKREEGEHSEEILNQWKTETQQSNLQSLPLHVWCQSVLQKYNSSKLCWLQHIYIYPRLHILLAALLGRYPMAWVSSTIQASFSQFHKMPFPGLCIGMLLPQTWLRKATEEDSTIPFRYSSWH